MPNINVCEVKSDLKDKVIVVTGAYGVLGKAVALAAAKAGATIVLIGRKEKALAIVYDQIVAMGASEPAMLVLDFAQTTAQDFFNLALTLGNEFTQIDGIVHCAASFGHLTPLALTTPEKWQICHKVNLEAAFLLTQALLPLMDQAPKASVIFTHHNDVANGSKAYWGPYAISKAGILSMMHLFAQEFEKQNKIKFNGVDPVAINSSLRFAASPMGVQNANDPKLIAKVYLDLLINQKNLNGHVLRI